MNDRYWRLGSLTLGFLLTLSMLICPQLVSADFRGELDMEGDAIQHSQQSLATALEAKTYTNQTFILRLMNSGELHSGWQWQATYLAEGRHGKTVALERKENTLFPNLTIDPWKTSLFGLENSLKDHDQTLVTHRLDRLLLSYSGTHLVFKAGRQALTWGNGLIFHPMDLFNPFSPTATYKTYKPGSDMLYGQWLFDSGSDFQGVVVPRRNPDTHDVSENQSSAGIKWHGFLGQEQQLGMDFLLAKDYQSNVIGFSLTGALLGATWTSEAVATNLKGGDVQPSLLTNLQYAWTWRGKNFNGYIEGFYNGLGVEGHDHSLDTLPAPLVAHLARGELFTLSKAYLALGSDIEWNPLLTFKPLFINNLSDGSTLFIAQMVYSVSQNTDLTAGLQQGFGERGTEYGGLETTKNSGIYHEPDSQIYARFSWYF